MIELYNMRRDSPALDWDSKGPDRGVSSCSATGEEIFLARGRIFVSILVVDADRQRAHQSGMTPQCKSSPEVAMSLLRPMTATVMNLSGELLNNFVYL